MGHKLPVKNSEKTGDYIQLKVVTIERLLALIHKFAAVVGAGDAATRAARLIAL